MTTKTTRVDEVGWAYAGSQLGLRSGLDIGHFGGLVRGDI